MKGFAQHEQSCICNFHCGISYFTLFRGAFFSRILPKEPTPTLAQLQNVYGEHYYLRTDLYDRHSMLLCDQYRALVPTGRCGTGIRRFIVTLVEVVVFNLTFRHPCITS